MCAGRSSGKIRNSFPQLNKEIKNNRNCVRKFNATFYLEMIKNVNCLKLECARDSLLAGITITRRKLYSIAK